MQQTLQHISAALGYGQSGDISKQIKLHLDWRCRITYRITTQKAALDMR